MIEILHDHVPNLLGYEVMQDLYHQQYSPIPQDWGFVTHTSWAFDCGLVPVVVSSRGNGMSVYMGGCQNYGPFRVLSITRHLVFREPKRGP